MKTDKEYFNVLRGLMYLRDNIDNLKTGLCDLLHREVDLDPNTVEETIGYIMANITGIWITHPGHKELRLEWLDEHIKIITLKYFKMDNVFRYVTRWRLYRELKAMHKNFEEHRHPFLCNVARFEGYPTVFKFLMSYRKLINQGHTEPWWAGGDKKSRLKFLEQYVEIFKL